jgi:glycosyltransferase involved in cell wall biosynthesis
MWIAQVSPLFESVPPRGYGGTPVITRRRGSVPEVVVDGHAGFVCETEDEVVAAVARVAELRRRACRAAFDARFTVGRMAEGYLRVYEREADRALRGRKPSLAAREHAPVADTA